MAQSSKQLVPIGAVKRVSIETDIRGRICVDRISSADSSMSSPVVEPLDFFEATSQLSSRAEWLLNTLVKADSKAER